jgi:hypothetical protein
LQEKFRRIQLLEPLLEEWRVKPGWLEEELGVVSMLRDQLELTTVSQEEILRINAICNTNTFRYTSLASYH